MLDYIVVSFHSLLYLDRHIDKANSKPSASCCHESRPLTGSCAELGGHDTSTVAFMITESYVMARTQQ